MGKRYIPKHVSRKAKKNRTGTAMAALAMSFVLLMILISAALGKYQHQIDNDGYVRAKEFYFTSNLLDGGTHTLAPINSEGKTSVTFTLGNHADDLRCSEVDISYTVTVVPADGVTVGQNTNQTLTQNIIQDDTVTLTFEKPDTYTVTAVGKGGYSKTLTATIVIPDQEAHLYQYRDNGDGYTLLTVWNEGNQDGNVTITYSGIPDNTNPNMKDWITGSNINQPVEIKAHESKVFRFFGGGVTLNVKQGENTVNTKSPH